MIVKLQDLLNIQALYDDIKKEKIPVKLAYKLNQLFLTIEEKNKFYVQELTKILEECAEKDEEGNFLPADAQGSIKLKEEYVTIAHKEIRELENLEIELPNITFSLDELDCLQLTLEQFYLLNKFIS